MNKFKIMSAALGTVFNSKLFVHKYVFKNLATFYASHDLPNGDGFLDILKYMYIPFIAVVLASKEND